MRLREPLFVALVAALIAGLALAATVASGSGKGVGSDSAQPVAARTLDLVWITDSSGWGVASFYARRISKDLGVRVRVHDYWTGGLPAADILWQLRNSLTDWIPAVRNAEVIVVWGNPTGLGDTNVDRAYCVLDMSPPPPAVLKSSAKYITTLKAIYRRIFAIRKGAPVILRTYNSVPVADVYAAFNGPSHLEDPVAKGYIQPDGVHPGNAGRAVIADALANLGYKQVKPPTR